MKLIQAIINREWEKNIKDFVNRLSDCLDERISWMEEREPESDGEVHNTWQDKYDELLSIYEELNEIIDADDNSKMEIKESVSKICDQIYTYQCVYGGLSRLLI